VGRARGFGRGQAELLAVMAMALVLAVLVAAVVRFAVLYQQARSGLEEKAREVYRVVLSGGVRGYVDTSTSTVYMSAGVPLVVYAVYIHNGTYVMWGSQVPPPYPSYATSQTAALSLSDYYTAVYRGSLARQVSNCSAWVVLVTDKGVFKWCPTCITLYATSLAVESPANPLGKFKAYYAGNLTYFALFGELTGDYYAYVEASRTTLYPLVLFYQDPVAVVYEQGFLRVLRVLAVAGTAVLLYPIACSLIAGGFPGRSELAVLALVAAALGVPGFYYTVRASRARVGDVVEEAANHVRVFRTMHLFRSARLEALQRARARPWLVDYLSEALGFLRLVGDVDPAVFEVFVEYVFEVERAVSKASLYMLTLSASALLAPYLATATISIGAAFGLTATTALLGYSTTLAFAYVATKMALGATVSTLLPGLAVLLYALTLP